MSSRNVIGPFIQGGNSTVKLHVYDNSSRQQSMPTHQLDNSPYRPEIFQGLNSSVLVVNTSACQFGSIEMLQAELKKKGLKVIMQDVDVKHGKPHIFGHFLS